MHKVSVCHGTGFMFKDQNDGWLIHNVKHSQREKALLKNNEDLNVVIDSVTVCFSYIVLFDAHI